MRITLPYKFKPRPYQACVYHAFFRQNKKRLICVWHRRAGKDKTFLNLMIAAAFLRVGNYIYLFPKHNQARRNIWNAIDKDGQKFLDHFPLHLIDGKPNNTEMSIKFINGSTFQLLGSDRYDAIRGSNPIGIVNSEYGDHHPFAWEVTKPILIENDGWAAFQGTPKGMNHFYELYEDNKNDDNWFCQHLGIEDTQDCNNNPILTYDHIQQEYGDRGTEWIDQEFYCSFTAANVGAYYAKEIAKALDENRIIDFEISSKYPVYTFWDIGVDDPTAIWFMQYIDKKLVLINYFEDTGEGLEYYADYLKQFEMQYKIKYKDHFAPFDIKVKEWGSGKTRIQQALSYGIRFNRISKIPIADGIAAVRKLFSRLIFHKTNCAHGIKCLKDYSKKYNEEMKCFIEKPTHSWSSHGADALRYLVVGWSDYYGNSQPFSVKSLNEIKII